jgi:hypothetical protein
MEGLINKPFPFFIFDPALDELPNSGIAEVPPILLIN